MTNRTRSLLIVGAILLFWMVLLLSRQDIAISIGGLHLTWVSGK